MDFVECRDLKLITLSSIEQRTWLNVFAPRAQHFTRHSGLPIEGEVIDQETYGSPYEQTKRFCSVCFELFEEKTHVVILNRCNHIFCYECIEEWSTKKRTCPLCKAVF